MVELLGGAGYGAVYTADKAAARQIVRDAIPKGSGITLGGSMTVESLGLPQTFRSPGYKLFDRYAPGATPVGRRFLSMPCLHLGDAAFFRSFRFIFRRILV